MYFLPLLESIEAFSEFSIEFYLEFKLLLDLSPYFLMPDEFSDCIVAI